MKRLEFSAKTKEAAYARCGGNCEACGGTLQGTRIEYDHIVKCFDRPDNSLGNCQVLHATPCHREKTNRDIKAAAKTKRIIRRERGIRKPTRFRGWRRMNGEIVWAKDRT